MLDRDMNGNVSCEELELACAAISQECKSISTNLKDLSNVLGKLDQCFTFIAIVITILVFLSLFSTSTAGL